MDRRRLWTYKGKTLKDCQHQYLWLFEKNQELQRKNTIMKNAVQCRENAELLAATAIIEMNTKEKVKSLVRTNMKPCEGCDECKGNLECYVLEVEK